MAIVRGARGPAGSGPTVPDPTGAPDGQVPTTTGGAYWLAAPAGGPALSSATPQPIGTATAGVSEDAARADHVHAPAPVTVVDLSDATGWTASAGTGASASIDTVSEQIELAVPAGLALGQRFALAYHDGYADGVAACVTLRLRAVTLDAGSSDYVQLLLIDTAGTVYLEVRVDGAEAVSARSSAGTGGGVTVASILDGQGWLRLAQVGGTALVYAGVGSGGAQPTSWTPVGSIASGTVTPRLVRLRVGVSRDAAGTGAASAEVGDVTVAPTVVL